MCKCKTPPGVWPPSVYNRSGSERFPALCVPCHVCPALCMPHLMCAVPYVCNCAWLESLFDIATSMHFCSVHFFHQLNFPHFHKKWCKTSVFAEESPLLLHIFFQRPRPWHPHCCIGRPNASKQTVAREAVPRTRLLPSRSSESHRKWLELIFCPLPLHFFYHPLYSGASLHLYLDLLILWWCLSSGGVGYSRQSTDLFMDYLFGP